MPPRSRRLPVTPESLHQLVFLGNPALSPDGRRIAFTHKRIGPRNNYLTTIWMMDTDRGDPIQFTAGDQDGAPCWSPDGRFLAFIGGRKKGSPQIYVIPTDGGEARAVTDLPEGAIHHVKWSPDGRQLAFCFRPEADELTQEATRARKEAGGTPPPLVTENVFYRLDGDGYFGDRRFKVYLVEVATGEHRMVYGKDTLGFVSFDWSPDSRTLVLATNRNKQALKRHDRAELLLLHVDRGTLSPIPNLPRGPKSHPIFSPDGRWIAYAGREGDDSSYSTENLGLWVCDRRTGRHRCLTEGTDWCLLAATLSDTSEASFEPWFTWSSNTRILARIGWHGEGHLARFDRSGTPAPRLLTLGRRVLGPGNLSADGRHLVTTVDQPTAPPEIHTGRVNATSITLKPRTNFNAEFVRTHVIAKPSMHWVRSADGTRVQTWLLRPANQKAKRSPGIVEIHGGPHAQYGWTFFHEFQVLAAAGYAVAYSNPRGSKGYGRDFCAAIRGVWGTVDWEDIHAVSRWLADRPDVDARRIGVMGGSYGGYMTNWAIGSTDMFTAAISDRCVSNLVSMGGTSDFPFVEGRYWDGNCCDRPENLWASSPIRLLGQAKTPTLVIHSEGDLRCNIEQGEQVFSALRQRNVPARFVRYPRETSHGMSRNGPPDMRLHRLHEILDWWSRWFRGKGRR